MSNGINSSQGWGLLRNLVANMGGKTEVSNADVQDILDKADTNNDNVVTEDEFITCFKSSELYQSAEEQYLQAYKVISMVDGDTSSMSADDIEAAIAEFDKLKNPPAGGAGGAGGTGGGDNGGDKVGGNQPPAGNTNPTGVTQQPAVTPTVDTSGIAPDSTLGEAIAHRAEKIQQLNDLKSQNNQAVLDANSEVSAKRDDYNNATKAFSDAIQKKADAGEQLSESEQQVLDLQAEKDACNEQITAANESVNAADAAVSECSSALSSIQGQEPQQSSYQKTVVEDGKEKVVDDTNAYNTAHSAWEAQVLQMQAELDAANDDLEEAKANLDELEASLDAIEADYDAAAEACMQQEKFLESLGVNADQICQDVTKTGDALDNAQIEQARVQAEFDSVIAEAQKAVDDADRDVARIEAEKNGVKIPEGYDIDEDGNIRAVDAEGNFIEGDDSTYGVQDTLPDGCEIKDGKIVDEDGNEVGTVGGTADKPEYVVKQDAPKELNFRERYDIVEELYNNPDADWSKSLEGLSDSDIRQIESIYNRKVEDFRDKASQGPSHLDPNDPRTKDFATTCKTEFEELSKAYDDEYAQQYHDILASLNEEPDSYADYLLEKGDWPLTEQEANDIAYELFHNQDGNWDAKLAGLSPAELQQIEQMYNLKVDDHYNKLLEADGRIFEYDVENFEYTLQDKVSDPVKRAEILKALAMTPEEAQEASAGMNPSFADYMMETYKMDINPPKMPEGLAEIIGEDTLAKREYESDADYQARIIGYINQIQSGEWNAETGTTDFKFTPQEQMEMIKYLNIEGGKEAYTLVKDYFNTEILLGMVTNSPEFYAATENSKTPLTEDTVNTFLDIMNLNTQLHGAEGSANSLDLQLYPSDMLVLLEAAGKHGKLDEMLQYTSVEALAKDIQSTYMDNTETAYLNRLFVFASGSASLAPENFNPSEQDKADLAKYGDSITKTLDALANGTIDADAAKWVLSQAYDSLEAMMGAFRGMTHGNQEKYLTQLFGLYSTESTAPATTTDAPTAPATQPDAGTTQPTVGTDDYNPGSTYLTGGTNEEPEDMTLPYAARS